MPSCCVMVRLTVLTESRLVIDGLTDGHTIYRASIASRGKKRRPASADIGGQRAANFRLLANQ